MKVWFSILCILLSSASFSQILKLNFIKGEKFEITTTIKLSSTTEIAGKVSESKTERISVQHIEIVNLSNELTEMEIWTSKLRVKVESNGQEIQYDSDKGDNPIIMAESFAGELGRKRRISVDSGGRLIKDNERHQNSILNLDVFTGNLPEGSIPVAHTAFVGKTFAINNVFHDSLISGAEKLKSILSGFYHIDRMENNIADILFKGSQKSNCEKEQNGQELISTSDCKVHAAIRADVATGIILHSIITYEGQANIFTGNIGALVMLKLTSESKINKY